MSQATLKSSLKELRKNGETKEGNFPPDRQAQRTSPEVLGERGGADRHGVRRSKKGALGRSKKTSHQTSLRMKQVSSPSFCSVKPVLAGRAAAGVMRNQRPAASMMRGLHSPVGWAQKQVS